MKVFDHLYREIESAQHTLSRNLMLVTARLEVLRWLYHTMTTSIIELIKSATGLNISPDKEGYAA